MRPIETTYRSVLFRSRLEARWAVFFDQMQIGWDYEPATHRGDGYQPDFLLPKVGMLCEVKPVWPTLWEVDKCRGSAERYGIWVAMLVGVPATTHHWALSADNERPFVFVLCGMEWSRMDQEDSFGMCHVKAVDRAIACRFDGYDGDRFTVKDRYEPH